MPVTAHQNRPLAALRATVLEDFFRSWRGRSGQCYICSIHPLDDEPAFDCGRAVVAAVRETPTGAAIAFVFQSSAEDFSLWARRARQRGVDSFHVHLLAETEEARATIAEDLRPAPAFAL